MTQIISRSLGARGHLYTSIQKCNSFGIKLGLQYKPGCVRLKLNFFEQYIPLWIYELLYQNTKVQTTLGELR